ncbi:MAG: sigma-70 family RNA polymerase sigma factor [Armatimonadota bacterium]|nr:sigma-70 family RNA polymerase sigma factor [Armatimonadota bacterium]
MAMGTRPCDEELAAAAAAGDDAAFEALFQRLYHSAYAAALRSVGDDEAAQDIAMQAFANAYVAMADGRFDPDLCTSFKAYLLRIVSNLCISLWRRSRLDTVSLNAGSDDAPAVDPPDPGAGLDSRVDLLAIEQAWPELSWAERTVLLRKYWAEETWAEVAEAMGMAPHQARYLAGRARRKIQAAGDRMV